ncbi:MAG TPA: hypothetical protein VGJ36_01140 [Gemmatimonadales bacterium]|jgi:hypothetical protein
MLRICDARSPEELLQARCLFEEYAASLGIDLCFQGLEEELATLPGSYAPPAGRLLLGFQDQALAGCVALRPLEPDVCEMKRLYRSMRLDSLPSMVHAIGLYRRLGFREIAPYRNNPVAGAVFLELPLKSVAP